MALTFWGLKTCDTCKKAQKALADAGVAFAAKDVRADGVPADELARWLIVAGAETLVNRRSTTWRNLTEEERAGDPLTLLTAYPTLIKRPVIADGDAVHVGWSKSVQEALI